MLELLVRPVDGVGAPLVLATVACGDEFFADWERFSLPNWERYARRHGYGLAVLRSSRLPGDVHVAWNKFLMPQLVRDELGFVGATLVLDADQVLSPVAPGLDAEAAADGYGLVRDSDFSGISQDVAKRLSFLRRHTIDVNYPLDSVSLMTEEDWVSGGFVDLGGRLPVSSGFIVVPSALVDEFAALTRFVMDPEAAWDGGGGDQLIASRELQAGPHRMLDRRWQGIWPAIMAQRYASLYLEAPVPERVAAAAIASALLDHWCVHFSISWPEKQYWKVDWMRYWDEHIDVKATQELTDYLHSSVRPREYGRIRPPEVGMVRG